MKVRLVKTDDYGFEEHREIKSIDDLVAIGREFRSFVTLVENSKTGALTLRLMRKI